MHTPCALPPLSPLLAFPPSPPLQFSTPVHHIVSRLFIFPHFLCPAPCAPYTPSSFLPRFSLSPRDVTFCTDSGAAASKLGQNWLKMCTHLVWCPWALRHSEYIQTPQHRHRYVVSTKLYLAPSLLPFQGQMDDAKVNISWRDFALIYLYAITFSLL